MQHRTLQYVAQFADVARPAVAGEQGEGVAAELAGRAVAALQFFENCLAQRRQVLQTLAQWRHQDRQHVEAVIQVGAEIAPAYRVLQVGGGRRDHPDVAAQHLVGADRLEFLFLQHAQQLALQRQRHVADLVEKQRAALGHLQLAQAALALGAGEGAGRGAEEFRFEEAFRNRRAVHTDEGFVRAHRGGMNGMGEQFLPRAGFAEQ